MKKKMYVLGMFPYPSGEGLHVGHVRIYTACDVMARYYKMKGYEVLSPMGWDAFGLPAENAAIKNKVNPQDIVPKNYANFKKQMQNLSFDFDWSRELATTDPTYYGLTQWIFLKLYGMKDREGKRLVYRENVPINWCPKCKTGIANEEVLSDGTHERCGTPTGKKLLPQWVMRITSYAEELLAGLDEDLSKWFAASARQHVSTSARENRGNVETCKRGNGNCSLNWPRGILEMQRNWIGKKEGMVLFHKVEGMDVQMNAFSAYPIWCFADTFMVIAPEHPLVNELVKNTEYEQKVKEFVEESEKITAAQRTEDKFEKKGVFTGRYVNDPFNPGARLPVWVANFAMMGFGTGIIRCSAHDPRDYEFAQKYKIPLKEVVERTDPNLPVNAHTNEGILKDSGVFTGKKISKESIEEVKNWIVEQGIGKRETTYHLRDWVFSRQRYWGEPIPLVYCDKCGDENGVVALSEKDLPLTLPYLESYEPTDTGESPLSRVTEWVSCKCPRCGGEARRETDTMPNWAGSCWYFLAFAFWKAPTGSGLVGQDTKSILDEYKAKSENPYTDFWKEVASPEIAKWLPADWYLGGAEHAVLHLLYARFWVKVLQDLELLDFPEPFLRLRSVGMVLAEDGRKMSKSWGNVINPDDVVKQYGSDAVRLYEMFMGPWDQAIAWDTRALVGQQRFLERVLETANMKLGQSENSEIQKVGRSDSQKVRKSEDQTTTPRMKMELAKLVQKVERGIVEQKFNTCIAGMMELVNTWRCEGSTLAKEDVGILARIMSPFAPQTAQQLYEIAVSHSGSGMLVAEMAWPEMEVVETGDLPVTLAVQVNGKVRGTVSVMSNEARIKEKVVEAAMKNEQIAKWVTTEPKKVIFVPGKILNLVV